MPAELYTERSTQSVAPYRVVAAKHTLRHQRNQLSTNLKTDCRMGSTVRAALHSGKIMNKLILPVLALEYIAPVIQDADGLQLETVGQWIPGIQKAW